MYRCAVARLALRSGSGSPAIFSSALARPSGLRVSCTPEASARYSRRREMANCTIYAAIGARMASTMAMMRKIGLPPSLLPPPPAEAEELRAQEEVADERDRAHEDADQRGEADVVVAHVRHLVRDHALELVAVHHREQAAGDRDRGVLGVAAGGERVGRRVVR